MKQNAEKILIPVNPTKIRRVDWRQLSTKLKILGLGGSIVIIDYT